MDEQDLTLNADESIDIKAFIIKCFHNWYYFVLFLVIAFIIATLINKLTPPVYKVTANILIKDEENPLDPQQFIGASLYGNPYKLQNEIGLIRSKSLTKSAILDLNLGVSYFREEKFISPELYHSSPFVIEFDSLFDQPLGVKFNLNFIGDTTMIVSAQGENVPVYNYSGNTITKTLPEFIYNDTVHFGGICGNQFCRFRIIPNFEMMSQLKKYHKYAFRFNSISQLIGLFRIQDVATEKNSSILEISFKCGNVQMGVDYLNRLSDLFLKRGIERQDKIAEATISFIDSQLKGISDSLRFSEDKLQKFRTSNQVLDLDFQAQQVYEQMEDLQNQKAQLIVKSKYYNYLHDYLVKNNSIDELIAPSTMDINDPLLNSLISELTGMYSDRTEMSFNSIKNNPYLNSLEVRIEDVKAKLLENIDNIINTSKISLQDIDNRISSIQGEISKLPVNQRELLVIQRKFKLTDDLYTYLLTKRSEQQISKASNIPSNEILDRASSDDYIRVTPNPKLNYIVALLLGLLFPASGIYLKDYFRNTITEKKDIQAITNAPVIGQILHNKYKTSVVVNEYPHSLVSESFRSLRTNFQFFGNADHQQDIVLITSVIKGEGKSFTSVNLGTVFAQNNKKVVVIDFDLRKSKIIEYLGIETVEGLSKYLSNNASLDDILFKTGIDNLDVIPSGPVPPNPTELISSARTDALFKELKKKYDIIFIDSPPVGLVSDALLLFKYASVRLLVVRQNFTPKNLFAAVMSDLNRRNAGTMNLVVNDMKLSRNSYGYGYGYGYGYNYGYGYGYGHEEESNSIIRRIKKLYSKNKR